MLKWLLLQVSMLCIVYFLCREIYGNLTYIIIYCLYNFNQYICVARILHNFFNKINIHIVTNSLCEVTYLKKRHHLVPNQKEQNQTCKYNVPYLFCCQVLLPDSSVYKSYYVCMNFYTYQSHTAIFAK